MFRKRHVDAKDIDTIYQHFADQLELHMGKYEKPVTADDISLYFSPGKEDEACAMIRKHEPICSGQLGEINVTKRWINIVPEAKPFNYAQYRAVTRSTELGRAEI